MPCVLASFALGMCVCVCPKARGPEPFVLQLITAHASRTDLDRLPPNFLWRSMATANSKTA